MPRSAWKTWFIRSPRSLGNRRPVPLAPRHRRVWRDLGRWCSCGLRWRGCPDRHAEVPTEPVAPPPTPNRPPWADVTMANPQVGRAGRLHPHDGPDPKALFARFLAWAPRNRP